MPMLSLKTSLRQISRHKLYSLINVIGLTTGITVMLFALLYWRHEAGFDKFHPNHKNIYRITTTLRENKDTEKITVGATGQVQGPAFAAEIPEIESYTRIMGGEIFADFTYNDKTFKLRPLYVDGNFLKVFNFPLVHGNISTALADKYNVVITESTALRFFGTTDAVGRTFTNKGDPSFEKLGKPIIISGVVKDPPENSSLQFDMLHPFTYMQLSFVDENWLNAYMGTFLVLRPNTDASLLPAKFQEIYSRLAGDQLANNLREYDFNPEILYGLQNIADIHFNPLMRHSGNAEAGVVNGSDPMYSLVFMLVAGFVLLMAIINFINITIASAIRRSKEVGIRKINGGSTAQITLQLLLDAMLLCFLSFALAMAFMYLLLPTFNELAAKNLNVSTFFNYELLVYFVALFVLLVISAGAYPAITLARFRPVQMLQNSLYTPTSSPAKWLVAVQFAPAIVLLFSAFVYQQQMHYIQSKDPGYNPDYVIRTAVYGDRDYNSAVAYLRNELAKEPSVAQVSFGNTGYPFPVTHDGKTIRVFNKTIDEHYFSLMEIPLLTGSDLLPGINMNDGAIVNESFVKAMGLQRPIGEMVELDEYYGKVRKRIVGVVKDHHYRSAKFGIDPTVFFQRQEQDAEMWVRINKSNVSDGIAALEKAYKAAMPGAIFEYKFLDELHAQELRQEERWRKAVGIGTILSFVICCLGLFALAHIATNKRLKEIGIRRVLGATVSQIVMLISSSFLKRVLIAYLVAVPIAWMLMNRWLMNFAYRIEIGVTLLLLTACVTLVAAMVAVLVQTLQAARQRAAEVLRG